MDQSKSGWSMSIQPSFDKVRASFVRRRKLRNAVTV